MGGTLFYLYLYSLFFIRAGKWVPRFTLVQTSSGRGAGGGAPKTALARLSCQSLPSKTRWEVLLCQSGLDVERACASNLRGAMGRRLEAVAVVDLEDTSAPEGVRDGPRPLLGGRAAGRRRRERLERYGRERRERKNRRDQRGQRAQGPEYGRASDRSTTHADERLPRRGTYVLRERVSLSLSLVPVSIFPTQ